MTEQERLQTLYTMICPTPRPSTWKERYAYSEGKWHHLQRAVWGNESTFFCSFSPKKELTDDILGMSGVSSLFFLGDTIEELREKGKHIYGFDLLSIPLEAWEG